MKEEIYFQTKWWSITKVTILSFILLTTIIFLPQVIKSVRENKLLDLLAILVIVGGPLLFFCGRYFLQTFLRFYEDGVSFIGIRGREFVYWNEIIETVVPVWEFSPIILKTEKRNILIFPNEFKENYRLINFLRQKTKKY
jgi:hypothetical protein